MAVIGPVGSDLPEGHLDVRGHVVLSTVHHAGVIEGQAHAGGAQAVHQGQHQVGLGHADLHAGHVGGGVDLLLGVEEVAGAGMQVGDAHQVVVLEGLEDFLADLAVQDLEQVVHAGVLIGHLQGVHEGSELSGGAGGYTGEVQAAELALLDGGALVAQLAGEVALDGDAAVGLLVHQVGKHLAGLAGDVLGVVAVGQAQDHGLRGSSGGLVGFGSSGSLFFFAAAAGAQGQHRADSQQSCKELFHFFSSVFSAFSSTFLYIYFIRLSNIKKS